MGRFTRQKPRYAAPTPNRRLLHRREEREAHWPPREFIVLVAVLVFALLGSLGTVVVLSNSTSSRPKAAPSWAHSACPWSVPAYAALHTPTELAQEVAKRMTLGEKASMVTFSTLKNIIIGVPRLCIANQTQSAGSEDGLGTVHGVTTATLSAPISVAASFDSVLAKTYGSVLGVETRAQGASFNATVNANLVRIPNWGRISETYGEDPYLSTVMTEETVAGIHSAGILAILRHFGPYAQDNDRHSVSVNIDQADLLDVYLAPFFKSVEASNPSMRPDGLMCSYGKVNGSAVCADAPLNTLIHEDGLQGFIRTDMGLGIPSPPVIAGGSDIVKFGTPAEMVHAVQSGVISGSRITDAVVNILTPFFARKLATHKLVPTPLSGAQLASYNALGLDLFERGAVLLKNDGALPLQKTARTLVVSTGGMGATCRATASALAASTSSAQCFDTDTSGAQPVTVLGSAATQSGALGNGATFHTGRFGTGAITTIPPTETSQSYLVTVTTGGPGAGATSAGPSGSCVIPAGDEGNTPCYFTISVPARSGASVATTWSGGYQPSLTITPLSAMVSNLRTAARKASNIVVVGRGLGVEGRDLPSLNLDGSADLVIQAIDRLAPTTVVLYGTGTTVMPWLASVKGVVEMWNAPTPAATGSISILASSPDNSVATVAGQATASVLSGQTNPSGRLPVTFPTSLATSPASGTWPGVNHAVNLDGSNAGLGIGYQWYQNTGTASLFPFGFGLSYTSFSTSHETMQVVKGGVLLKLRVTNTGRIPGRDVIELYADYAHSPGGAARNLVGFSSIALAAGQTKKTSIFVPYSVLSSQTLVVGAGGTEKPFGFAEASDATAKGTAFSVYLPVHATSPS